MTLWQSPHPPLPDTSDSIIQLIQRSAERCGSATALVESGSDASLSYHGLMDSVGRFANGLCRQGFKAGDVFAIQLPNSLLWVQAALGALAAGGVVTGCSPLASPQELTRQLRNSGATHLLSLSTTHLDAASALPIQQWTTDATQGRRDLGELLQAPGHWQELLEPHMLALLPYSSGTSGQPKGVMLTHGNLSIAARQANHALRTSDTDVVLALPPFHHILGFVPLLCASLVAGACVVCVARFDFEQILQTIQDYRVTVTIVPPPLMQALAAHPRVEHCDLSSLHVLGCGGAPISAQLEQAVADRICCIVAQGYGMTETTSTAALPELDTPRRGSVGRLCACTEARAVDPDSGAALGAHQQGELWLRGPQIMRGYLNNPEADRDILVDGWLRTGDLAYFDDDGYLYIVDRLKELIKVNAYQVAPAELEALLLTHPQVADAAVVGQSHECYGEVPVAYIVPRGEVDPEQLMAWVAEQVAPYKRIHEVRFLKQIPKSPAGKILRRLLLEREPRGQEPSPV